MQKLYCYVDETGQDTEGTFFLVALLILRKERNDLRELLRKIEKRSGKATKKWTKTTLMQKQAYVEELLKSKAFHGRAFYHQFSQTKDYLSCIIETIVKGISQKTQGTYKATILIDGLGKKECRIVGAKLRKRNIKIEKVRGVRAESDEFIRVADALAGFIRDALEGKPYTQPLFRKAFKERMIEQL